MLGELFRTGVQLTQVIGLCCLLWGAFIIIAAIGAGRGPIDLAKGALLMAFGVYLAGLGQGL
ncbi:hypothetical protein [Methylosinus sp. Sm6]|uniref:hypothetical protein n=1 Tax=Methylosinus sp. Sm6 TaxID=2866948 RepID=UPI001C996365|nr:hypothetical protein [Methylosinus sp. Sm6]MBY6240056.1 hypothetical protein [Methylosinus sp. Sm6]